MSTMDANANNVCNGETTEESRQRPDMAPLVINKKKARGQHESSAMVCASTRWRTWWVIGQQCRMLAIEVWATAFGDRISRMCMCWYRRAGGAKSLSVDVVPLAGRGFDWRKSAAKPAKSCSFFPLCVRPSRFLALGWCGLENGIGTSSYEYIRVDH